MVNVDLLKAWMELDSLDLENHLLGFGNVEDALAHDDPEIGEVPEKPV